MEDQDRSDKQPPDSGLDERAIQDLTAQLDEAIPRDGAIVVLDEDQTGVIANRLGYLRLGVEFLHAAFAGPVEDDQPACIEVDLAYLFGKEPVCYWFCRDEDVARPDDATAGSGTKTLGTLVVGILVLLFLGSLAVGAITIARWLYGLLF